MSGQLETAQPPPAEDAFGGRPESGQRRRGRHRPLRTAVVTVVVLAGAGATAVATLGLGGRGSGAASHSTLPPATAQVARATLRETTDVDGTLGYGDSRTLAGRTPGVLTGIPAEGTIVRRGQALYTVDQKPVTLLYGGTPAYSGWPRG